MRVWVAFRQVCYLALFIYNQPCDWVMQLNTASNRFSRWWWYHKIFTYDEANIAYSKHWARVNDKNVVICYMPKSICITILSFSGGGDVIWHCLVPGSHRSSKFKLQYVDIWFKDLLKEYQIVVLCIYPVWGWFSAPRVTVSIHSLVNCFLSFEVPSVKVPLHPCQALNHCLLVSVLSGKTTDAIKVGSSLGDT